MKSSIAFGDNKIECSFHNLNFLKSEDKRLHVWLAKAFEKIEADIFCGAQISKRLIPKYYIGRFGIDNIWKYNLPDGWRLICSLTNYDGFVITVILEWLPHGEYEKRFSY